MTAPRRVLVIGSGPIVIGQAAEFDYAGVQACLALRAEGVETVLVNSNPATVMTDPDVDMSSPPADFANCNETFTHGTVFGKFKHQ